jgi:hypothetical protein
MTISLTHPFVSALADGGNATLVQPSNWNAEHTITMATAKVLGRATTGTGAVEELSTTGSGSVVLATSPTLVTPVLGVATATSVNGLTITTTTGTFTLTNGKTLTVSNTLTLAGTDASTLNIGTGGTLGTAALKNTGTSGDAVPLLNGVNTWSAANLFNTTTTTFQASAGLNLQLTGTGTTGGSDAGGVYAALTFNATGNRQVWFGGTDANLYGLNIVSNSSSVEIYGRKVDGSGAALAIFDGCGIGTTQSSTTFLNLAAGTTAKSALRFVQGAAPTSPVDGDMWREDNTNTGLKVRINGVTKTITVS